MLNKFKIKNFRCFQELVVDQLTHINLIAGLNNVGKTSFLEALFLHCGANNPGLALTLNANRGLHKVAFERGRWGENPWNSLFYNYNDALTIELAAGNTSTGLRSIQIKTLREAKDLARVGALIDHRGLADSQSGSTAPAIGVIDSTDTVRVLEWICEEQGRKDSFFMIADQKGIRVEPVAPAPPFPTFFMGTRLSRSFLEEAERFGKLEVRGQQDVVVDVLKSIEPRLKRLAIVVVAGEPVVHGDVGLGRLLPLPLMGEGIVRLATLIMYIGNAPGGVVLIDEIENGFHHSVLAMVWDVIGEAARRFDTQVFATTHSLECIAAAHQVFSQSGAYDFRLNRLEAVGDQIVSVGYDQETLASALETGLEVR